VLFITICCGNIIDEHTYDLTDPNECSCVSLGTMLQLK